MEKFKVTGMSCAACSARVEKAVGSLEGVDSCSVSLLTGSMSVEGSASDSEIIAAVKKAGYDASPQDKTVPKPVPIPEDKESAQLIRRLLLSVVLLLPLMYLSMGHNMLSLPLPFSLEEKPVANALIQLLLALAVILINNRFFVSGFKGLLHKSPNMDTLVALGSGAALVSSIATLCSMVFLHSSDNTAALQALLHELYFESSAMILTLITVGKTLEAKSKGRTTDAISSLMAMKSTCATLLREGKEVIVDIADVKKGDVFVLRPGEKVPVDGVILQGAGAFDESALTGESIPADKHIGDSVSAATVSLNGYLHCQATAVGEDTTLSQIIQMVSDAAATKAPIAKAADKVSGIFVPAVMGIALITAIVWLLSGQTASYALARGISVLVISCPCALGLATPVAIMVGSGIGAKNGILFKTAASLESAGRVKIAVLDKTGTITKGEPEVTDIIPAHELTKRELVRLAASLEYNSEHPLSKAIISYAEAEKIDFTPAEDFTALTGKGLCGKIQGRTLYGGKRELISELASVPEELSQRARELSEKGRTPLYFAFEGELCGIIAVADAIKPESPEAIRQLRELGLQVVMLTGDNHHTAREIGRQAGVDRVIADVLPEGKEKAVRELQAQGRVLMVGDGINDAPALTGADVGMAIGAGTDIALEAADIVLMKSRLTDVPATIRLSRRVLRTIHQNLFWAFFYNALGIPLAAGLFIPLLGWELNPMFGAAAMSLSSFCVVTNALRLNLMKPYKSKKEDTAKDTDSSKKQLLKVKGMMCPHCEQTVEGICKAFPGIASAKADHKSGTVTIKTDGYADMEKLREELKKAGYRM